MLSKTIVFCDKKEYNNNAKQIKRKEAEYELKPKKNIIKYICHVYYNRLIIMYSIC